MAERFKLISETDFPDIFYEAMPIALIKSRIMFDNETQKLVTQIKLMNISDQVIDTVYLAVKFCDVSGAEVSDVPEHVMTMLDAQSNQMFGEKFPLYATDTRISQANILVTKVLFKTGEVWENKAKRAGIKVEPARVLEIKPELKNKFFQEANNLRIRSDFQFEENDNYIRCSCGFLNASSLSACKNCSASFENIRKCYSEEYLTEKIYEEAEQKSASLDTGILMSASALFESISGYQDSESKAVKCKEKAEKIKADKAEQERLESERKESEKRRREAEQIVERKRRKKRNIIVITVSIFTVACAATAFFALTVLIPTSKYNSAVDLFNAGRYDEAAEAFAAIDYDDSAKMVNESKYQYALKLYNEKNYLEAEKAFLAVEYNDSSSMALDCRYQIALAFFNDSKYDEAEIEFSKINYKDSIDMASECKYKKAEQLFNEKDYENAINLFEKISDYKDSKSKITTAKAKISSEKYSDVIKTLEGNYWYYNGGDNAILNVLSFQSNSSGISANIREVKFDGNGKHSSNKGNFPYIIDADTISIIQQNGEPMDIKYSFNGTKISLGTGKYFSKEEVDAGLQGYWKYTDSALGCKAEYNVLIQDGKISTENASEGYFLSAGEYYYYGPYDGSYSIGMDGFTENAEYEWFFNIISGKPTLLHYYHICSRGDKLPGQHGYKF